MNSKILIAHSEEVDIFANLAKEEYLLDSQNNFTAILFLWQSSTSIVIGKHQNPWKEALVNDLKKQIYQLLDEYQVEVRYFMTLGT